MNASDTITASAERPARGPTKRQLSAAATRDRIIEATILCMANYGPAGASVEKITATAGVSRGLVRHHFGSKNQLFLEAFERLADEMRQAFGGDDPEEEADPIEALRRAIANEFRVTTVAPVRAHAWFGFWQAALGDPALQEVNDRVYAEERERFSGLFRAAADQRSLSLDHREAGIALVALVDGAWNELLMRTADFGIDDAQTLCNHFIDMIVGQGRTLGQKASGTPADAPAPTSPDAGGSSSSSPPPLVGAKLLGSANKEVGTMICEIARNLDEDQLERVRALEDELGALVVAFSCRTLDPEREEKLRKTMEGFGPMLQVEPVAADEDQLERIRAAEARLGMALVAVNG